METKETKRLKEILFDHTKSSNNSRLYKSYSVSEVNFENRINLDGGMYEGTEYVDFVSLDNSSRNIICYEIKVSVEDLFTKNALSFYGDNNYLVLPKGLWDKIKEKLIKKQISIDEIIGEKTGIQEYDLITGKKHTIREAIKKDVGDLQRRIMLESILKKMFYKSINI